MSEPVMEVVDAVRTFAVPGRGLRRSRGLTAVDHVSLAVGPREIVALVGESGSGKSTLGRLFLGLDAPSAGIVRYRGEDVRSLSGRARREFRRDVQVVFQDTGSSLNPRRTVGDSVAVPLRYNMGLDRRRARDRAGELLEMVGLPAETFAERSPLELSGGQRQRVSIARAMASEPGFVVADEAVSALDVSVRAQVLTVLRDLQRTRELSYLFITHDIGVVRAVADRVVVLYLGQVVESGPVATVLDAPAHPYTAALLAAAPKLDPAARFDPPPAVLGDPPSPVSPPPGCRFHPRCPIAVDRCRTQAPPHTDLGDGQVAACHLARDVRGANLTGAALRSAPGR